MTTIAVIGEAVADAFLPAGRGEHDLSLRITPGGSPANTAVALARLGTHARFVGRLSGGVLGGLLREHLLASGVDLAASVTAAEQATLAVAALDEGGHAAYDFYVEGTADWAWTAAESAAWPDAGLDAVHTGSLALALEPGAGVITARLAGLREHATVSIDPNVRPRLVGADEYRRRLPEWLRLADVMKVSDEDLSFVYPGEPVEAVCDAWHRGGARLVVVTLGGKGALGSLDGERIRVPAVPVTLVDTIGAGDAFTAGLLHDLGRQGALGGRLDGLDAEGLRAALGFAARVAAYTCRTAGANPPWARDLADVSSG